MRTDSEVGLGSSSRRARLTGPPRLGGSAIGPGALPLSWRSDRSGGGCSTLLLERLALDEGASSKGCPRRGSRTIRKTPID